MRAYIKARVLDLLHHSGITSRLAVLADRYSLELQNHRLKINQNKVGIFAVLVYHRVNDSDDPFLIQSIPSSVFTAQMAYLRKHFSLFPLSDLLQRAQHNCLPSNAISITFDDGYRDNYEVAFPILQRYSIPATIFLTTETINTGSVLWFDKILFSFKETRKKTLELPKLPEPLLWNSIRERAAAASKTLRYLRSIPNEERERQIEEIPGRLNAETSPPRHNLMLTWDQIRIMRRSKIEFGSHSVTHPILSQCQPDRILYETANSKKTIEEHLDENCRLFAYPSGRKCDISLSVVDAVSKAGYNYGVTIISGANHFPCNPFLLKRISAPSSGVSRFGFHLAREKFKVSQFRLENEDRAAKPKIP